MSYELNDTAKRLLEMGDAYTYETPELEKFQRRFHDFHRWGIPNSLLIFGKNYIMPEEILSNEKEIAAVKTAMEIVRSYYMTWHDLWIGAVGYRSRLGYKTCRALYDAGFFEKENEEPSSCGQTVPCPGWFREYYTNGYDSARHGWSSWKFSSDIWFELSGACQGWDYIYAPSWKELQAIKNDLPDTVKKCLREDGVHL